MGFLRGSQLLLIEAVSVGALALPPRIAVHYPTVLLLFFSIDIRGLNNQNATAARGGDSPHRTYNEHNSAVHVRF